MENTAITIEPAKASDIPALLILLEELFRIEADFTFEESRARNAYDMLLADRERPTGWVARCQQQVVAMCSLQTRISTAQGGRVGLIEDVFVLPEFRGQGVGTLLLDRVGSWAQQAGYRSLELIAEEDNHPALAFYQKRGWQTPPLAYRCIALHPDTPA